MKLPDALQLIVSGDQSVLMFLGGGYFYLRLPDGEKSINIRQKYDKDVGEWLDFNVDNLSVRVARTLVNELYRAKIRVSDIAAFMKVKPVAISRHIATLT